MILALACQFLVHADEVYPLRLFFGLPLPGGDVSLGDWRLFQQNEIAKAFEVFNVEDSVGFIKISPNVLKSSR